MDKAPARQTERGNTYDKYATQNPVERRMMEGFLAALDEALPDSAPERILEVGSGEGEIAARVLERYPNAGLTVLDLPSEELAEEWRDRRLAGLFGDITGLPFEDRTFDLVLAIEVLEHVPEPANALAEIARVARDATVLSVPREPIWRMGNMARGRYWRSLGNTPGHVNHWSSGGFARFVGTGLDVLAVHRPLPWTLVSARART